MRKSRVTGSAHSRPRGTGPCAESQAAPTPTEARAVRGMTARYRPASLEPTEYQNVCLFRVLKTVP